MLGGCRLTSHSINSKKSQAAQLSWQCFAPDQRDSKPLTMTFQRKTVAVCVIAMLGVASFSTSGFRKTYATRLQ